MMHKMEYCEQIYIAKLFTNLTDLGAGIEIKKTPFFRNIKLDNLHNECDLMKLIV